MQSNVDFFVRGWEIRPGGADFYVSGEDSVFPPLYMVKKCAPAEKIHRCAFWPNRAKQKIFRKCFHRCLEISSGRRIFAPMMTEPEDNEIGYCAECGAPIGNGRPDRKFCSPRCKSRWHNHKRHPEEGRVEARVLRILRRNREILAKLPEEEFIRPSPSGDL